MTATVKPGVASLLSNLFGGGGSLAASLAEANAAWYAATTIFIDPAAGSDDNAGTTTGAPLKTYAEAVRRWGGDTMTIPGDLTITWKSSHTDGTDPVIMNLRSAGGGRVVHTSTGPTTVTAGVILAGVTAKNRAAGTNSPLIANLGATGAVGQMVINTTAGKSSRAFVMKDLGGHSFVLSQPMAPQTASSLPTPPTEVDTWANGDTVTLAAPIRVNFVELSAVIIDANNPTFNNSLTIFNVNGFDPLGPGNNAVYISQNVWFIESLQEKFWSPSGGQIGLYFQGIYSNCVLQGGGAAIGAYLCTFYGGGFIDSGVRVTFLGGFCSLDGDCVLEDGVDFVGGCSGTIGLAFAGNNINVGQTGSESEASALCLETESYGSHVLYGAAGKTLSLWGRSRLNMATGTWAAGITAPGMLGGIVMNGGTVAQTHTNASPDVVTSGVTTSVANADAANGGNMMVWGGASISKAA